MKTLLLTIAAGLVTVTILAGCGDTEPTPYVVVGDDESGSIDGFDDGFQEERIRIVEWVAQERGTLVADAIDGNAAARFKKRVEHTFAPADGLGGNPVLEDDDLDRQAEELTATLEPTLREGAQTPGTDILGFAVAAANAMPEGRPTTLVLLTDGRQNAPAVDPLRLGGRVMDKGEIDAEVERLAGAGLVARFPEGTRVQIVGGGRSGGAVTTPEARTVEEFWRAYFRAAGARLVAWGPRFEGGA